ncbi:hypothetical protein U1Q18_001258 [Sarracenia purpurea var. burkii]
MVAIKARIRRLKGLSPVKLDSNLVKKDGSGDVNLEKKQGIFEASLARVSSGFDTTKHGEATSQPLDSAQGRRGSSTRVEASLKGFSPIKMGSLKIQSCAKGDRFGNALTLSVATEALASEDEGEESEEDGAEDEDVGNSAYLGPDPPISACLPGARPPTSASRPWAPDLGPPDLGLPTFRPWSSAPLL